MVRGASLTNTAPPNPVAASSDCTLISASLGEVPVINDTAIRSPSGDHTGQLYIRSLRWGCANMPGDRATVPEVNKRRSVPSGLTVNSWPSESM